MLKVLSVTPRTVTLELQNDRPYYAEEEFSVYVNGSFCRLEKEMSLRCLIYHRIRYIKSKLRTNVWKFKRNANPFV